MIFLATENFFKCQQLNYPDLPKPLEWLADAKHWNAKWVQKKAGLIACQNYDSNNPLCVYCELMQKWTQVHKMSIE